MNNTAYEITLLILRRPSSSRLAETSSMYIHFPGILGLIIHRISTDLDYFKILVVGIVRAFYQAVILHAPNFIWCSSNIHRRWYFLGIGGAILRKSLSYLDILQVA